MSDGMDQVERLEVVGHPPTKKRRRPKPGALVSGATSLAALAASIVALVFVLRPDLSPDPETTFRATLRTVAVEPTVTYGRWLDETTVADPNGEQRRDALLKRRLGDNALPQDTRGLRALTGTVVYIATSVEGFKRRSVNLRWTLYDAHARRRLTKDGFSGVEDARISLDAPTDRTIQEIWVPPPPRAGRYFVRLSVYDDDGALLDLADSPSFSAG